MTQSDVNKHINILYHETLEVVCSGGFKVKKGPAGREMDDWILWDMNTLECDLSMGRGENRAHLYLCEREHSS